MRDLVNDGLHIFWGAWIVFCFWQFPPWAAAVLAILPREMEQTYHALDGRGLIAHCSRWGYWEGKLRDLGGFLVGAAVLYLLL